MDFIGSVDDQIVNTRIERASRNICIICTTKDRPSPVLQDVLVSASTSKKVSA